MRRLLLALAWKLDHFCHAMIERLDPVEQADVRKMLESAFGLHPRRNCDRFNTGDVEKDADAALRAMLDEMKSDGNFGYRGVASYLLSPAKSDATATPETPKAPETPEAPKGGAMCGDNRFELIESAKRELMRCTNIEGSPDEMAVLDSLLFRMWQMRWLPGCEKHDAAATAEAAGTGESGPEPVNLFPKGVRPATEEEVEAGDAQWCEVCRMTCPCKGKDILVHGCSQASPKDSLS